MPEKQYKGIPRNQIPWDPKIDNAKCITCGKCVNFCHQHAFNLEEKNSKKQVTINPNHCVVLCRGCENVCPTGAISHPEEEETQKIIDKLSEKAYNG